MGEKNQEVIEETIATEEVFENLNENELESEVDE